MINDSFGDHIMWSMILLELQQSWFLTTFVESRSNFNTDLMLAVLYHIRTSLTIRPQSSLDKFHQHGLWKHHCNFNHLIVIYRGETRRNKICQCLTCKYISNNVHYNPMATNASSIHPSQKTRKEIKIDEKMQTHCRFTIHWWLSYPKS